MPLDSEALMLTDVEKKYEARPSSPAFSRLYEDVARWGHMFAVLHDELNVHFELNQRQGCDHKILPGSEQQGLPWGAQGPKREITHSETSRCVCDAG